MTFMRGSVESRVLAVDRHNANVTIKSTSSKVNKKPNSVKVKASAIPKREKEFQSLLHNMHKDTPKEPGFQYFNEMTAEQNTEQVTKDEIWENLKANLEALEKPRNLLLLGSLGTGKSSFINTVITALTGKYKYYADVGRGSSHNTMRLHMIPSAEYWNPENKEIKAQNLPTFIDIIGLETSLSESKEEISVNKELMRLIINGQLPQNCDLFDLSNKLKNREKINIKPDLQIAAVDIIIVVLSAENYVTPDILLYDICKEAKFETKNIPVFLVLTNVDKSNLSEKGLEEKKNDICSIMNIEPYKVLMCSNYQPDHKPSIKKDIKILEFLMKENVELQWAMKSYHHAETYFNVSKTNLYFRTSSDDSLTY
uniref:Interferon-induced protein 44-like protein n=1 Tax=Magallana gigas TaxID=29159 RepID=K1R2T2_MAGGI